MRIRVRSRAFLALTLALVASAACVTTVPPAGQTTAPTVGPAVATETPTEQSTQQPNADTPPPQNNGAETFLAWIVGLGPGSPEGPTQVDTYKLLLEATVSSCRQALNPVLEVPETLALYKGAAAACLAALHGRSDRWGEAQEAFDSLPGRPDGCVDQATYDLLESVLAAHEAFPDARFTREGEPADGQPDRIRLRCLRLDDVSVIRGPDGLTIDVSGNRLDQAIAISYAAVESCPQVPEFESPLKLTPSGDAEALHALVETNAAAQAAEWLWVGVLSEPTDWVAASDCVQIQEASPA